MIDRPFISHFSPQRTDPELLEQIHVQRHELVAESVARMRESVLTQDKHHLLFIGPRGAGKTHLVRLIHHRLSQEARTQPELAQRLRFAWLNEDETATSFLKLLILIYRDVSQRYPEEFPAADLQRIYGQSADLAREQLGKSLLRHLGSGRTLVVLMENLDSLFKHMPEGEQRIWRAFVQNHPVFATVGTAQSLFDGVSDRNQPFFGFFDTRHLQPLSVEDAVQLLEKLARLKKDNALADFLLTPTGHARVQAIHDLAGGNPRIYLIFSEFLTKEALDDLVRPFEETADRQLTSYYQERLRWLSAQQQEIIQFLCHHGQPVPVKAIAEGLFTTHNSITGQLKVLREMRYVIANQRGREVFYELAEPLMRLALQIKETHDRRPLTLIVDLLRVFYEKAELEKKLRDLPPESRLRAYYVAAIEKLNSGEPNLRHLILRRGLEDLDESQCDDATLARVICLAEEAGEPSDLLTLTKIYKAREDWRNMLKAAEKVFASSVATQEQVATASFYSGIALSEIGRQKEALLAYKRAIEKTERDNLKAWAHYNLGTALAEAGQVEEAVFEFTQLLGLKEAPIEPLYQGLVNRSCALMELQRPEEALVDIERVVASPEAPQDQIAMALVNRAIIEGSRYGLDNVMTITSRVLDMNGIQPGIRTRAAFLRTLTLNEAGKHEEFCKCLFEVLESEDIGTFRELLAPNHQTVSLALVRAIFDHPARTWPEATERAIRGFSRIPYLPSLGRALIRHISEIDSKHLSHEGLNIWFECWNSACEKLNARAQMVMTIPIRWLRVGIDYLNAKNESILFTLPLEERRILRAVLNLPPERQP